MGKPCSVGTITKILEELDNIEVRRFFYEQANQSADTVYEHLNVGNAKLELGEKEEALEHYNKAISISIDFLGGYVARARCLIALGRTEEALKDHEMPGAADGKKFGEALDYAEDDCLQ